MKSCLLRTASIAVLLLVPYMLHAQGSPKGAAERGGGWPYPEPAFPGATGYTPDYSQYEGLSERWDIYVNLLWRKTGSLRNAEHYGAVLSRFMRSLPTHERAGYEPTVNDLLELMRGYPKYYDAELAQFMQSLPPRERVRFETSANELLLLVRRIRSNQLTLPYRDGVTGCLFFMVRKVLAADGCKPRR